MLTIASISNSCFGRVGSPKGPSPAGRRAHPQVQHRRPNARASGAQTQAEVLDFESFRGLGRSLTRCPLWRTLGRP